jgi:predicted PurR-regulated permease PerM
VVVTVVLAVYSLGWAWINLGGVVWLVGGAALGAYLINPLVYRLENRGMGRGLAIAAVFLGVLSALVLVGLILAPHIQRQGGQAVGQLHGFIDTGARHLAQLQRWAEHELPPGLIDSGELQADLVGRLRQGMQGVLAGLTTFAVVLVGNLAYVVLAPVLMFLLLLEGPGLRRRMVQAVPNPYFEPLHRFIIRVDEQLGSYIRGVLLVALGVGGVATVGLWLCGMRYFFIVGPFIGLLNVIPLLGPLVGMAAAAAVMVMQTGEAAAALGPMIVGATAQILDNVLFTPVAVSRSVDLPPLLVLIGTLVGGELFGLVGLLAAVPLIATAKVLIQALQEARRTRRSANWEEHLA